jgi:ubiquinone/menaquinone biosynthesis C-methylase UbiE
MTAGTTPEGAHNEQEAARWVRGMFGRVAHRYDLANHLLSGNLDRWWRAHTVRRVRHVLERPGARVLDICCGTGDLLLALEKQAASCVFGSDFCHPMLVSARGKIARRQARAVLFESDALNLPLRDASLDLLTVAFGFRNLANYGSGLAEMRRVLKPGGRLAFAAWPPEHFVGRMFAFVGRNSPPPPAGAAAPPHWGNPAVIAERLAAGFEAPFFARETMSIPALSVAHFRLFMEKSVGPMQKLVESLAEEPEKLAAVRAEFDALARQYYEDNVVRQDYILARARAR